MRFEKGECYHMFFLNFSGLQQKALLMGNTVARLTCIASI